MNSKITEVFYVVLRSSTVLVEGVSDIDIPFFFDKTMHSEPVTMFVDAVLNADTDTGIRHLQTRQRG